MLKTIILYGATCCIQKKHTENKKKYQIHNKDHDLGLNFSLEM